MQSGRAADVTCPACQGNNIDESIEPFQAVCESCGFVLREDGNSASLEWEVGEDPFQRNDEADWLSECRVRNATEQQLAEAFKDVEAFVGGLGLPDEFRESTVDVYCDAFRRELTDGRDTSSIVAACFRIGSFQIGKPVPRGRIIEFESVDQSKFQKSHTALCSELELESKIPEPKEYLPFLQHRLGIPEKAWDTTESLLSAATGKQSLIGKDPAGIAAGAVYLVCENQRQCDVAREVGLSTETVRHRIKQLQEVNENV
jgi:transcription initiation factor TFIIB